MNDTRSNALTATPGTQHGPASLLASTSAWIARVCTGIWAFILVSFGMWFIWVISLSADSPRSTNLDSWQLNQLRTMKVGGNGSATEFFTKHGGSSLLTDADTKKKYSARVAELYKEELARRVKEDAARSDHLRVLGSICLLM